MAVKKVETGRNFDIQFKYQKIAFWVGYNLSLAGCNSSHDHSPSLKETKETTVKQRRYRHNRYLYR